MHKVNCVCCNSQVSEFDLCEHEGDPYCSWECVEHVQDQEQEYLDSYEVGQEDQSGEYRSLYN